jgi:hypothetical protein
LASDVFLRTEAALRAQNQLARRNQQGGLASILGVVKAWQCPAADAEHHGTTAFDQGGKRGL